MLLRNSFGQKFPNVNYLKYQSIELMKKVDVFVFFFSNEVLLAAVKIGIHFKWEYIFTLLKEII